MLSSSDFEYIAKLVKDDSGISLDTGKEYLVISRVEPLAKSLGYGDISALVSHLKSTGGSKQRRQLIESLTTHETSFFRDHEPFELLAAKVLPELIARNAAGQSLTVWCGASSSGQEPFSLSMLLNDRFPQLASWKVDLLATDLSHSILEKAKSAAYNQIEVNRGLPVRYLARYFEKEGNCWHLKPEIRSLVRFDEQNLLHPLLKVPPCDLVMLRNVLIYFDIETKKQILEKVYERLKPGGYLLLGTAETTLNLNDRFERVTFEKASCYRKGG